ncbi:MAG: hypothetical protein FJ015_01310 [Chloroflexi bacterium]|nr:hypothetical protein [Chloroflexota bacterium]
MRRLRLGMAQINTTIGDFPGNKQKILKAIDDARALGVDLLTFPELAICGYPPEDLLFKPQFISENLKALDEVVRSATGITVVVGFVDPKDELVFDGNSMVLDEKGELIARGEQFAEDLIAVDLDIESVFRARLHDPRWRKASLFLNAERRQVTSVYSERCALGGLMFNSFARLVSSFQVSSSISMPSLALFPASRSSISPGRNTSVKPAMGGHDLTLPIKCKTSCWYAP